MALDLPVDLSARYTLGFVGSVAGSFVVQYLAAVWRDVELVFEIMMSREGLEDDRTV